MKVSVTYIFSKNNKIGSKIIRWATSHLKTQNYDTPSHAAILVNHRWVHESTLESGVRVVSIDEWSKQNVIVCSISCPVERDYEEIKKYFGVIRNKKYDWLGVIYLGFYILLSRYFGIKIPDKNKWQSDNKYFCTEVIGYMINEDFDMKSPTEVYEILRGKLYERF